MTCKGYPNSYYLDKSLQFILYGGRKYATQWSYLARDKHWHPIAQYDIQEELFSSTMSKQLLIWMIVANVPILYLSNGYNVLPTQCSTFPKGLIDVIINLQRNGDVIITFFHQIQTNHHRQPPSTIWTTTKPMY